MSSQPQDGPANPLDDIAFLKALAVEGGRPPALPGGILALIGSLFTAASLIQWAALNRYLDLAWPLVMTIWLGAAAFGLAMVFLALARHRSHSARSAASRAARLGMSLAIYVMLFIFGFAFWKLKDPIVMELFSATIFAVYGAYWAVAAVVTQTPWFRWVSGAAFVIAIGCALLLDTPHFYLASGLGIFAVACVPGLVLLRGARAART